MKYIKFLPFYLISLLPWWVLYALSNLVFVLIYRVFKYRRIVVRDNLNRALVDRSEAELNAIEKKFYQHFCDLIFETIKGLTISRQTAHKRYQITNLEVLTELYAQKRDVIFYMGHLGNWEWTFILPLLVPYRVTAFYLKLSNDYFDELIKLIRTRFGLQGVLSNRGYRTLVGLKQKEILSCNCMLGDQSPNNASAKHWITFLNQETAFLTGAETIARKLDHVLVFPSFRKHRRGYYEVELKLIEDNPKTVAPGSITDRYAQLLEDAIQENPELWLWTHRRWKLTRDKV